MINPLDIVGILEQGMGILNGSKYFAGIMMLLMNLGARNIAMELSEMHEKILGHKFIRRLLVFVLVFYATRDVKVSIIITIAFIILVSSVFHEDSDFCILPTKNIDKISESLSITNLKSNVIRGQTSEELKDAYVNSPGPATGRFSFNIQNDFKFFSIQTYF